MSAQNRIDRVMMNQLKELLDDRFNELLERFVEDSSKRLGLLKDAVPSRNYKVIHSEAHGLKGSCRNLGANPLGDLCSQLEDQGKSESDKGLESLFAAVEQEFAGVLDALQEYK